MFGSGTELPGVAFAGQGMRPDAVLSSLSRHGTQPLVAELLEVLRVRALPALDLTDTRAAQPAIYVAGLVAALARLGPTAQVPLVAGHSLGELAALAYAGVISAEDGLRLAAARGRLCRAVQLERPGAMIAVVGLEPAAVELLRRQVVGESAGVLEVAAVNARRQVVLSGDRASVLLAIEHAGAMAARAVTLPIDGAFHSPLMVGALPKWRAALRETAFARARTTVVSCVDGEPHDDPADLRELLAKALVLPVRWTEVTRTVRRLGVHELWDAGPGTILRGLARRGGPVEFVEPVPVPAVGSGRDADQLSLAGEGDQILA